MNWGKHPFLFIALCAVSGAGGMPVEPSHPVAGFLRRLEEKGAIPLGFWSTLPRDEAEVGSILKRADGNRSLLTSWDRRRLDRYLNEFDPDRRKSGTLLKYQDTSISVIGGVEYFTGVYYRDSIPTDDLYAFGNLTPSLQALYQDKMYLTSSFSVASERNLTGRFSRGDVYDPQTGLPYNSGRGGKDENVSTFDGFRLMIGAGTSKLGLEAGQDWNQWGPGHWQHATLGTRPYFWVSDSLAASPSTGYAGTSTAGIARRGYRYPGEGPPLPQLRFRIGGTHWEYVKIIGQRTGLWKDSTALLIADRLQFRFGSVRLGLTQMMAVAGRSPGFINYLPGVLLKLAEHEGGDQDNIAMSGDVEWIWTGRGRLYAELYVDDYAGGSPNQWVNKFATVAGASFQDPFGIPSELHVEYAAVDPWVYQHYKRDIQMNHYGALLGSGLPPNSRAVNASLKAPLFGDAEGTLEWNFRQRDWKSKGSSLFDVHEPTDTQSKEFLARDVETRNQLMLSADWSWKRFVQLKAGAGWLWADTWRGKPGVDVSTPSLAAEWRLRY